MTIISARNLAKHYGRRIGLGGIDLDVPEGALFGFLGPNGAGKTTAIRILTGFLRPTEGAAHIFGLDCWGRSHVIKRDVGYLPGDLRLYPWMSGGVALRVAGEVRGRDIGDAGRRLARRFDLDLAVRVKKMSRGMRQKLGLILALAHEPRLLLLDEPTSGLDPLMRDVLADLLRERAAAGCTVFFSSHTLSEVEQLCDRVAIVRAGRIVVNESLSSLREQARRSVIIRFERAEDAASLEPPAALEALERSGRQWRAELVGPAPALLGWAAAQALEDIVLGPPDLESLFRR
ncbi:MAG: ABC transporter ATP-binding protein, partial [Planctomycetota bacterium]